MSNSSSRTPKDAMGIALLIGIIVGAGGGLLLDRLLFGATVGVLLGAGLGLILNAIRTYTPPRR